MKIMTDCEGIGSFVWNLPPELVAKVEERVDGGRKLLQVIGEPSMNVKRAFIDDVSQSIGKFLLAITAVYSAPGLKIVPAHLQLRKDLETLVENAGKVCE